MKSLLTLLVGVLFVAAGIPAPARADDDPPTHRSVAQWVAEALKRDGFSPEILEAQSGERRTVVQVRLERIPYYAIVVREMPKVVWLSTNLKLSQGEAERTRVLSISSAYQSDLPFVRLTAEKGDVLVVQSELEVRQAAEANAVGPRLTAVSLARSRVLERITPGAGAGPQTPPGQPAKG